MSTASPKLLKHFAMVGTLAAFAWVGTALAQTTADPAAPMAGPDAAQTGSMEHYLNNHPEEAKELHENPSLINDPNWLAKHPTVQHWMNSHPNVKQDAIHNPNDFVHHTERETVDKDHRNLNSTDRFLSRHPDVAKQLNENPKLIDDPQYRADHPELNNYLNKHPGVADEWKRHPNEFAKAVRANGNYNRTGHVREPRTAARK